MDTPKVSIVIPAYNASNYLAEAIDSALAQTYPNVEIIVVNDGSKDDGATEQVALSYGNKIRYFFKENGGSSSALNLGIANMTGEWFSWLSHDDLYAPEKIQRQIEYMSSLKIDLDEQIKHVFFTGSELINADGKRIRTYRKRKAAKLETKINSFSHNGYLIAEPTVYNFHGCSCLVHKNAFAEIGYFDESLRLLNDVDMWFRLYAANFKVHYIPEVLVYGRIHSKQVSKNIGFSYHNSEQDMFWNRTLEWLLLKYPNDEELFFRFGKNAYLKTRNVEGDRAFDHVKTSCIMKNSKKNAYKFYAFIRNFAKMLYLKIM